MKFLVRFFIFLSLLCSLAFSKNGDNGYYYVMRDYNLDSSLVPADAKFLKDNKYIGFRMPVYDMYEVVSYRIREDAFYFAGSKSPGFYRNSGYSLYFIGGTPKTGRFSQRGSIGDYERYVASDNPKDPIFTYYTFLEFNTDSVAKCGLNQEFNTDTMQCVDTCPAGQKWDVDINACANDCTDTNLNKFGYFNGTTQGKCVDCSNVYSDKDIASCLCVGLGSSFGGSVVFVSDTENPSIVRSSCADGTPIIFKRRSDEDPNKDKEKDKDKEDPNKDKDKENPNKDKDKENPNKDKDNNSSTPGNGNNSGSSGGNNNGSSGNNGGSGGGSSGGTGGGSSGGSGGGTGGGSSGGKGGGSSGGGQGNNGNSENATPGNIDYGELEERTADLANMYKENINNLFEPIDGIKKSLNDTISKIKDGNLMSLKKGGIPNTCPLSFDIDMVFFSKKVVFDFCSILSPIASSLYVFFFVTFFLLFLFLIAKLFIFTFMGW